MTSADPRAEYERRLAAWRERTAALDRLHFLISNARLLVAAALAVTLWLAAVDSRISMLWPFACGTAFVALVVAHAGTLSRLGRARRAERVYGRGIDRLLGRWTGTASGTRSDAGPTGRDGSRFLGLQPYARDLDLLGPGSLFELLNVTRSEAGEQTLAAWLSSGAPVPDVKARQEAVQELREKVGLREDVAVLAPDLEMGGTDALRAWASSNPAGLPGWSVAEFAGCAAVLVVVSWLVYRETLAERWLIVWAVVEWAVAMAWRSRTRSVLGAITSPERDLALMVDLLARLEAEPFTSVRLVELRRSLGSASTTASRRIAQLRQYVSWLDSAHNLIFRPFAYALMLPQLMAVAIDRWHRQYGSAVIGWLTAIGEIEALSAMATYAFEHPHDPFPTLVADGAALFDADAMAHPLMSAETAVPNDVRLGSGQGSALPQVIVISGSNMSGKSTLLRSVGLNVALALAGAPVRAAGLRLSPVDIGATLRIDDSLQAGHSRFYSEILRIKRIVDRAREAPVLFLLDEILHGTNSHDRRIGAEAIVSSLVQLGAIGLVTTHDLALTELPPKLRPLAANMHFADRLDDGRIVFDYRMRPGVVEHSNALALMRAIGLEV
jgi:hypothetical protein